MRLYALVSPEGTILHERWLDEANVPSALAPGKPRYLPVEAQAEPDPGPGQVVEGPVVEVDLAAGEVRKTFSMRDLDAGELAQLRARKVAEIKAEAGARILAIMPEVQQRNSLALGMEMVTKHGPDPAGWPAPMLARYQADIAAWDQIKAIRARSDVLEAALPETAAELAAFEAAQADWAGA